MTEKRPNKERAAADLHRAVQAFLQAYGGTVWVIGKIRVDVRNPTSYNLIIECVGHPPTWH